MKSVLFITMITISMVGFANPISESPAEKIEKYTRTPENAVMVPTNFAKEFILTPEALKELKGHNIYLIELVYTKFRESESFDQNALNDRRQRQLTTLLPQVKKDNPTWKLIEQVGAKTAEEAHNCFHGFVIHYGDDMSFQTMSKFFEPLATPFTEYKACAQNKGTFQYESGTTIHVPENALTYEDGSVVRGDYTLKYKEYRNQADIALSGIPMTYTEDGEELNFVSSGMYEIRAEQNGRELSLQEPISIDFACTDQAENVDYYVMDDVSGEWTKLNGIDFTEEPANRVVSLTPNSLDTSSDSPLVVRLQTHGTIMRRGKWQIAPVEDQDDKYDIVFSKKTWDIISEPLAKHAFHERVIQTVDSARTVRILKDDSLLLAQTVHKAIMQENPRNESSSVSLSRYFDDNDSRSWYNGDAGSAVPNLVMGLEVGDFGVFNCDQAKRLRNRRNVSPLYVNAATGDTINKKLVTCVIDRDFNASLSFQPGYITFSQSANTTLLLFTADNKIFAIDNDTFKNACLIGEGMPEFEMTELTSSVKQPEDLQAYLKL